MSAKAPATVMRFKVDVIIAAATRKACEEAVRIKALNKIQSVDFTTIRDEDGWVNPAYIVTEKRGKLDIRLKRRRHAR